MKGNNILMKNENEEENCCDDRENDADGAYADHGDDKTGGDDSVLKITTVLQHSCHYETYSWIKMEKLVVCATAAFV